MWDFQKNILILNGNFNRTGYPPFEIPNVSLGKFFKTISTSLLGRRSKNNFNQKRTYTNKRFSD